ncbi:MAG TPA: tetratricopeptide repeat protein [Acidobacteriota bacterium]|nr:tetratricopeptide repeat protein [Acidobacteriota bacterium]
MSKDNLVFLFGGVIVGIIAGVILANYSAGSRQVPVPAAPAASMVQQQPAQQTAGPLMPGQQQQQLPEGHPPINEDTMKQEITRNEDILKKDPENQDATVALGNLYFDMQQFDKAMGYYQKAVARDAKNVNLITDLGTCYLRTNDYGKALELYNRSLGIDPNHFQTLMNLGIARMATGDRKGAAEAWEKVIQLYPDNPEAATLRDAVKKLKESPQGSM